MCATACKRQLSTFSDCMDVWIIISTAGRAATVVGEVLVKSCVQYAVTDKGDDYRLLRQSRGSDHCPRRRDSSLPRNTVSLNSVLNCSL